MSAESIERELMADVEAMPERLADEKFCTELYRAITRRTLRKPDVLQGHAVISYGRAEKLVNELRARHGHEPLTLAQTGGEGEVSRLIEDELGGRGWRFGELDTGRQDDAHLQQEAEQGRTDSRADSGRWEREAHEAADEAERLKRP